MAFHRDLRAHSCLCLRGTWGRALCSWTLPWNPDEWRQMEMLGSIPTGFWAYRNSQVLQGAPSEPKQSSSALFFFCFSQSCSSFPAEMEPWGSPRSAAADLRLHGSCAVLSGFCSPGAVNPILGWLGLAKCPDLLELPPGWWSILPWHGILVMLELECWVWASALAAEQAGGSCRRKELRAFLS